MSNKQKILSEGSFNIGNNNALVKIESRIKPTWSTGSLIYSYLRIGPVEMLLIA